MSLSLNTCIIARRGKGAKGTIEVSTFGIPIKSKKNVTTRKWSYDKLIEGSSFRDIVDSVEEVFKNHRLLKKALLIGADAIQKSQSLRNQSEAAGIIRMILEKDLATDKKTASNLAKVWQQTQAFQKKSMVLVSSIEDLIAGRQKYVDDQKEKGLWVASTKTVDEMMAEIDDEDESEDEESEEDAE